MNGPLRCIMLFLAVCVIAAPAQGMPNWDSAETIEGLLVFPDHQVRGKFYYAPPAFRISEKDGVPEFSFRILRYSGNKETGDAGEIVERGWITFSIVEDMDFDQIASVRRVLSRRGGFRQLERLPIEGFESWLTYESIEGIGSGELAAAEGEVSTSRKQSSDSLTFRRQFMIGLPRYSATAFWNAYELGGTLISADYAQHVRGVTGSSGDSESGPDERLRTFSGSVRIDVNMQEYPELFTDNDLRDLIYLDRTVLTVICFDMLEEAFDDVYRVLVDVRFRTRRNQDLVETVSFDRKTMDVERLIRFALDKDLDAPYRVPGQPNLQRRTGQDRRQMATAPWTATRRIHANRGRHVKTFGKRIRGLSAAVILAILATPAGAVVLFDEGGLIVDGVQLLQDSADPKSYYYVPTSPRVSMGPDGKPELLFVKFVGEKEETSGGLIHFLFTLDLPPRRLARIEEELKKKRPGAVVRGPVPLFLPEPKDANQLQPSFTIVSGTLSNPSDTTSFTRTLVTSGAAPLTPGSKAAVAARLDAKGATLLWDTFDGGETISDVSIAVTAYYEAAVRGYRGTVRADVSTVYEHMFKVLNLQKGYTKRELREQMDELERNGAIEVEVTDRAGRALQTSAMAKLMETVTEKLVDMLFDTTSGITALPQYEVIPASQVPAHQHRSWINEIFGGNENPAYRTDNQYTLRERSDIKRGVFSLSFTQNTTLKVPFNTSGNMRGLYEAWKPGEDADEAEVKTFDEMFKIIDSDDPDFQRRELFLEIDPDYSDQFATLFNGVVVEVIKKYDDQADFSKSVTFTNKDVTDGTLFKSISYPRLGIDDAAKYKDYAVRTQWILRGGRTVSIPSSESYESSTLDYIPVVPPATLQAIEYEADDVALSIAGVRRITLLVEYELFGERQQPKRVSLRPGADEMNGEIRLLHDPGTQIRYRARWYDEKGSPFDTDWMDVDLDVLDPIVLDAMVRRE